jgi:chaperone modulatory protein CbpM
MTTSTLQISIREFCECEGIPEGLVVTVVEHGIARPLSGGEAPEWVFDTASAGWIRKAIRLRRDLEVDWVAVAMVIDLLQQREQLQLENRRLRQRLRRFATEG